MFYAAIQLVTYSVIHCWCVWLSRGILTTVIISYDTRICRCTTGILRLCLTCLSLSNPRLHQCWQFGCEPLMIWHEVISSQTGKSSTVWSLGHDHDPTTSHSLYNLQQPFRSIITHCSLIVATLRLSQPLSFLKNYLREKERIGRQWFCLSNMFPLHPNFSVLEWLSVHWTEVVWSVVACVLVQTCVYLCMCSCKCNFNCFMQSIVCSWWRWSFPYWFVPTTGRNRT